MDLALPDAAPAHWKSASRRIGVNSEAWAARELYCVACDADRLTAHRVNQKVEDFHCPGCDARYQLKAKQGRYGASVTNSDYASPKRKRSSAPGSTAPRSGSAHLSPPKTFLRSMDHRAAAAYVAGNMRRRLGAALDRVILYGSVARHEERPESDVDLIVVAKHYKQAHDALLEVMGDLLEQDAPYVSVRILTQGQVADMERRHATFWETVSREGETLA